jgi:hypothetical protein
LDLYDFVMPRFVVLLHETPAGYSRATHFDLMLEHGELLRTWALKDLPEAGQTVIAERLPDHRPVYLDYEGEVAGDRGSVRRVDAGLYDVIEDSTGSIVVRLHGGTLTGTLTLAREGQEAQRWRVSLASG